MAVALGPGKFYGSSLPRPRFYTDVKFADDRVDPPAPMLDPLLSWATDAHWSMGGLSNKRLRLQGQIEGNVKKLQKEREKSEKNRSHSITPVSRAEDEEPEFEDYLSDSPPPTPIVVKKTRSRRLALLEEEEEEEPVDCGSRKRRLNRKLKDDFDLVADDAVKEKPNRSGSLSSRSRKSEMVEEDKTIRKKRLKKAADVNRSASPVCLSPNRARISPKFKHGSR